MEPNNFASGMHFSILSSEGIYITNCVAWKAVIDMFTFFLLLLLYGFPVVSTIFFFSLIIGMVCIKSVF